jgi:serine protease AprX
VVRQHLVGQQLVREHLVREHLVGRELELMNTVQRRGLAGPGHAHRLGPLLAAVLLGSALVAPTAASAKDTSTQGATTTTTVAGGYDPATDPYSMASTAGTIGATAWWAAGYTGAGVDVALIDTGVAPVQGLSGAGKVVYGPDLSLESQNPTFRYLDTNGHGTFMAGLIAANSADYMGVAPGARIVSLKVGTADGGVDVSQVIAAIDWVIQHKTDNGLNIRVINLSYGTNANQSANVDPLSFAVEQAWLNGIVVVAAAGNGGYQKGNNAPCLANPAYNRLILAVGGADTLGTAPIADDQVGPYSASSSSSCPKLPDFLAVGSHLQGLRVPGSYIDQTHPEGLLGDRFFRGSGTSEAAAITSGAIALVLQRYPALTPDTVRRYFTASATLLKSFNYYQQGAGEFSLSAMLPRTPVTATKLVRASTGTGTLEGARGTDRLTDGGVVLSGEQDIFGMPFDSGAMATLEAAGRSWSGGTWNGTAWTGGSWADAGWAGRSWSTTSWTGRSWSGDAWAGRSWSANAWDGRSWSGLAWTGRSWSGDAWSGRSWSDGGWN